jgi:RNA recognition motif-containing protein
MFLIFNAVSAIVIYHDYESAETAKKFLDQKELNTRKIKITIDQNREPKMEHNFVLKSKLSSLKKEEKIKVYRYLKQLRDQEGQMFVDFLDANPWLSEELIKIMRESI